MCDTAVADDGVGKSVTLGAYYTSVESTIKFDLMGYFDLFWCRQSFTMHLVRLMTSWAVVCEVWYLEPQTLREGETPIEFSERCTSRFPTICSLPSTPNCMNLDCM